MDMMAIDTELHLFNIKAASMFFTNMVWMLVQDYSSNDEAF